MFRRCLAVLFLFAASDARALPVQLLIADDDSGADGFVYSVFRAADDSWVQPGLTGSLLAELEPDGNLTAIHGTIVFDPIAIPADLQAAGLDGSLEITGGRIDLHGDGDPGEIASYLAFDNGMTLYFPDQISSGAADSFDGVQLWLRSAGDAPVRLDMLAEVWSAPDLSGRIHAGGDEAGSPSPVPEPASMGLLAAGGLIIGSALRKSH